LVARTISFNADDFHHDEALLDQDFGEPLGLGVWDELVTPEERAPYANKFL
jgi:hypothetical protein